MQTKVSNLIYKIKKWISPSLFVKCILLLSILVDFPYVNTFSRKALSVLPLWGMLIIYLYFSTIIKTLRDRKHMLLIAMAFSYGCTILLNYKHNFIQNTKFLVWFLIYIGILMIWWKVKEQKNMNIIYRDIQHMAWIIVVTNMLNVVPSVVLYCLNILIEFQATRPMGIFGGRLYCLMSGVNAAVMLSVISIFLGIVLTKHKENACLWKNVILFINGLFSYVFIIASGTRSARVVLAISAGVYFSVIVWKKIEKRKKSKVALSIGSGVTGLLCIGLVYAFVVLSRTPIGLLPNMGQEIKQYIVQTDVSNRNEGEGVSVENNQSTNPNIPLNDMVVLDGGGNDNKVMVREEKNEELSFQHRINIWTECLRLLKSYPLFGVGNANLQVCADNSQEEYKYINIPPYGASTHSMPVAVLIYSGVVGFAIIFIYFISKGCNYLSTLLMKCSQNMIEDGITLVALLVCIAIGVYSMVGTCIMFSNVMLTIIFWICWGLLDMEKERIELENS